jgi:hypothetical protein
MLTEEVAEGFPAAKATPAQSISTINERKDLKLFMKRKLLKDLHD